MLKTPTSAMKTSLRLLAACLVFCLAFQTDLAELAKRIGPTTAQTIHTDTFDQNALSLMNLSFHILQPRVAGHPRTLRQLQKRLPRHMEGRRPTRRQNQKVGPEVPTEVIDWGSIDRSQRPVAQAVYPLHLASLSPTIAGLPDLQGSLLDVSRRLRTAVGNPKAHAWQKALQHLEKGTPANQTLYRQLTSNRVRFILTAVPSSPPMAMTMDEFRYPDGQFVYEVTIHYELFNAADLSALTLLLENQLFPHVDDFMNYRALLGRRQELETGSIRSRNGFNNELLAEPVRQAILMLRDLIRFNFLFRTDREKGIAVLQLLAASEIRVPANDGKDAPMWARRVSWMTDINPPPFNRRVQAVVSLLHMPSVMGQDRATQAMEDNQLSQRIQEASAEIMHGIMLDETRIAGITDFEQKFRRGFTREMAFVLDVLERELKRDPSQNPRDPWRSGQRPENLEEWAWWMLDTGRIRNYVVLEPADMVIIVRALGRFLPAAARFCDGPRKDKQPNSELKDEIPPQPLLRMEMYRPYLSPEAEELLNATIEAHELQNPGLLQKVELFIKESTSLLEQFPPESLLDSDGFMPERLPPHYEQAMNTFNSWAEKLFENEADLDPQELEHKRKRLIQLAEQSLAAQSLEELALSYVVPIRAARSGGVDVLLPQTNMEPPISVFQLVHFLIVMGHVNNFTREHLNPEGAQTWVDLMFLLTPIARIYNLAHIYILPQTIEHGGLTKEDFVSLSLIEFPLEEKRLREMVNLAFHLLEQFPGDNENMGFLTGHVFGHERAPGMNPAIEMARGELGRALHQFTEDARLQKQYPDIAARAAEVLHVYQQRTGHDMASINRQEPHEVRHAEIEGLLQELTVLIERIEIEAVQNQSLDLQRARALVMRIEDNLTFLHGNGLEQQERTALSELEKRLQDLQGRLSHIRPPQTPQNPHPSQPLAVMA